MTIYLSFNTAELPTTWRVNSWELYYYNYRTTLAGITGRYGHLLDVYGGDNVNAPGSHRCLAVSSPTMSGNACASEQAKKWSKGKLWGNKNVAGGRGMNKNEAEGRESYWKNEAGGSYWKNREVSGKM
ncbi:hypothetical protein DPMN_090134 [Dreissena polymorpha]|uniref:Uncharacterized protein n=1 Tax=Dreissena polymorpha TaxID=45954 RepID=A0A9D4KY70_DREPO|nr:hypothetical protein DPMN_090134 [Dreissena polymorpha]